MFNFFLKTKNSLLTKFIWIMLMLFCYSNLAFSFQGFPREDYLQSELIEKKISESTWSNAKSGLDYSNHKTNKKKKKNDGNEAVDDGDYSGATEDNEAAASEVSDFWTWFFKFLFITMVVIILAFIIANVVGAEGWALAPSNKKFNSQSTTPITLANIEERIHESDLNKFIREALDKENYPMAIRLYYLAIIKELSLKNWIKWEKDKTNRDYTQELSTTNWHSNFRSATVIFEKVWYGKQELSGMDFKSSVQPKFQKMLKEIQLAKKKSKVRKLNNLADHGR